MLFFNAPSGIRDAKTLGWIVRAKISLRDPSLSSSSHAQPPVFVYRSHAQLLSSSPALLVKSSNQYRCFFLLLCVIWVWVLTLSPFPFYFLPFLSFSLLHWHRRCPFHPTDNPVWSPCPSHVTLSSPSSHVTFQTCFISAKNVSKNVQLHYRFYVFV